MELDESLLTDDDWAKLEETAKQIIKNATRDLILWSEVLKHVRAKREELPAELRSLAEGDPGSAG